MSRFINAENLKKSVESWLELDKYYHPYSKGVNIPTSEVLDLIETEPTADVRENAHGIWREVRNVGETSNWECSVCGCVIADVPNDDDHPLYAYCPCCGADMQSRLQGTEIDGTYIDISGDGTVVEQI